MLYLPDNHRKLCFEGFNVSIYFTGMINFLDQADLIQRVCRRSGLRRHANAPERRRTLEGLA